MSDVPYVLGSSVLVWADYVSGPGRDRLSPGCGARRSPPGSPDRVGSAAGVQGARPLPAGGSRISSPSHGRGGLGGEGDSGAGAGGAARSRGVRPLDRSRRRSGGAGVGLVVLLDRAGAGAGRLGPLGSGAGGNGAFAAPAAPLVAARRHSRRRLALPGRAARRAVHRPGGGHRLLGRSARPRRGERGLPGGEAGGVRRRRGWWRGWRRRGGAPGYWTCLRQEGARSTRGEAGHWVGGGGGVGGRRPGGGRALLAHQDRALPPARDPPAGHLRHRRGPRHRWPSPAAPALRLRAWCPEGWSAPGWCCSSLLEGRTPGGRRWPTSARWRRARAPPGTTPRAPEWARYLEAAAWLGENAGPEDVALGRRHFLSTSTSGHYADKYRFETTADELDYLFSGTMPQVRGGGRLPRAARRLRPPAGGRARPGRRAAPALRDGGAGGAGLGAGPPGRGAQQRRRWRTPLRGYAPVARPRLGGSGGARLSLLVFVFLFCLYALTGGGQGYSVDGTFSYEVARSLATDPAAGVPGPQSRRPWPAGARWCRRWASPSPGPATVWAQIVPPRESVPLDGRLVGLLGLAGARRRPGTAGRVPELRLPLDPPRDGGRLAPRLLPLPRHGPGAGGAGGRGAGARRSGGAAAGAGACCGPAWTAPSGPTTCPWPSTPRHRRAPLAGHWPGNPGGQPVRSPGWRSSRTPEAGRRPGAGAARALPGPDRAPAPQGRRRAGAAGAARRPPARAGARSPGRPPGRRPTRRPRSPASASRSSTRP